MNWGFGIADGTVKELRQIAGDFGVTLEMTMKKSRLAPVVKARWACWEHLESKGWSSSAIGKLWNMDHSTVLSAKQRRVA